MTHQVGPIRLLIKTRGVPTSALVTLGACGAVVVLSSSSSGLFSLVAGGVTPLARLVTVLVGIAIAAPLVPRFERDYMSPVRRDVRLWGLAISLAVSIIVGLVLGLFLAEPNMWAMPRLLTFWTFLAIVSSNVVGARYGWLLPALVSVGISLFSPPDATSSWNIIMSTENSPFLWGIVFFIVLAGVRCTLK